MTLETDLEMTGFVCWKYWHTDTSSFATQTKTGHFSVFSAICRHGEPCRGFSCSLDPSEDWHDPQLSFFLKKNLLPWQQHDQSDHVTAFAHRRTRLQLSPWESRNGCIRIQMSISFWRKPLSPIIPLNSRFAVYWFSFSPFHQSRLSSKNPENCGSQRAPNRDASSLHVNNGVSRKGNCDKPFQSIAWMGF